LKEKFFQDQKFSGIFFKFFSKLFIFFSEFHKIFKLILSQLFIAEKTIKATASINLFFFKSSNHVFKDSEESMIKLIFNFLVSSNFFTNNFQVFAEVFQSMCLILSQSE